MRAIFCCYLLVASPALRAFSVDPVSPVTVLVNYEQPYSQSSFQALRGELQRLLDQVGVKLDVRMRHETAPHEQFAELVVFRMRGVCSMSFLPVGALSDERGALAMAYSSDGSVLPFGEVECDRVRESLQRITGRVNPNAYQATYGTALGMVMAHEIYHMLSRSPEHTRRGVTKESLSARELLEGQLSLPDVARLAMRRNLPAK